MTHAHRAKKSLGQNFLVDANQQRRIVDAIGHGPDDVVLEIGPGQGALTQHLAGTARRLLLVELDDDLARDLRARFATRNDVVVVHDDFMQVDIGSLVDDVRQLFVVGNIPYNITSPIIFRLLERDIRPRRIVLMIQKEVADRILAPPGGGSYGALSVGVRAVARVHRLFNVPRGSFRPVPRVDSTVIAIEPFVPAPLGEAEERDLRTLTRAAFSWRRKQLQKILRAAPAYRLQADQLERVQDAAGVRPEQRPEDLAPEQFIALCRALQAEGRPLADAHGEAQ